MSTRPNQHQYLLLMARVASLRGTCARRRTGAIITDVAGRILSTGYNGVSSGKPHCIDVPCQGARAPTGQDLHLCKAIHAEVNAIVQCHHLVDAHRIYCTNSPCQGCLDLLIQTPIIEIHYAEAYEHDVRMDWVHSKSPSRTGQRRTWVQHSLENFTAFT